MEKYKSTKEDLQDFFTIVFGSQDSVAARAEQLRSGIYKIGAVLGVGVVILAMLLLKFTI